MSNQGQDQIADALARAISSGTIPAHLQEQARSLLEGMTKPVRLTVFGLPGSGKSTLVNLLLGKEIFSQTGRLPTTQITWGEGAQATCTMGDGSKKQFAHFNTSEIAPLAPIFVQAELPLQALGKISLLKVVADGGPAELTRALAWASSRTDVTLWCSQSFGGTEQQIWDTAPDEMKDHAFLLLTKADLLAADGTLNPTLAEIREQSADQFKDILPIATRDAIAARGPDGAVDKDRMTASGGRALIAAILHEVDLGRQAARDQAELLLHRYLSAPTAPAEPLNNVAPLRQPEPATPIETLEPPAAAPTPAATVANNVIALHPQTRVAYENAIDRLSRTGQRFAEDFARAGSLDTGELMAETMNCVQWLCDYLSEGSQTDDPALVRMRDTAFDAADLMQLMQMESETDAVLESLCVVIQLKREMEAGLAA